ncbi:MAG: transposase, partial [Candidatus Omnitrophota bacterium]
MPRQARIIIPYIAHHITQRGNYGQAVFEEDADYEQYLNWLKEYIEKYRLKILSYCLMTNHVHFVVIPEDKEGLS